MDNELFETERIIVRRLSLQDAELLFKYSQEEITKKELPDEVFENVESIKKAIDFFMINYDYSFPLVYGIYLKEKAKIIGHISLSEMDKGVEIGYAISTEYQNKGYASEIITPFINWSKSITFTDYPKRPYKIKKIFGIAKKENIASWKVLEKNGFKLLEEGIYKNYFGGKHIVKIFVKNN